MRRPNKTFKQNSNFLFEKRKKTIEWERNVNVQGKKMSFIMISILHKSGNTKKRFFFRLMQNWQNGWRRETKTRLCGKFYACHTKSIITACRMNVMRFVINLFPITVLLLFLFFSGKKHVCYEYVNQRNCATFLCEVLCELFLYIHFGCCENALPNLTTEVKGNFPANIENVVCRRLCIYLMQMFAYICVWLQNFTEFLFCLPWTTLKNIWVNERHLKKKKMIRLTGKIVSSGKVIISLSKMHSIEGFRLTYSLFPA